MKKIAVLLFCFGVYLLGSDTMVAQKAPQKVAREKAEQEKGPAIFDYEPHFLALEQARRSEIDSLKQIIDSLDISESKRLKLIKDLYRNKESKRLNKVLMAANKFEDDIEE